MIVKPLVLTWSVTWRLRLGTQKRLRWMFTFHRRLVRLWEWEMEWPKLGTAPVTWQCCRDMQNKLVMRIILVKC